MKKCGLVFLAAVSAVVIGTCPAALAISRPHVDPTVPPPSGKPVPAAPMERRGDCTTAGVLPGSNPGQAAPSQTMLDLPAAWKLSRGEGQLVAIIDTGVRRGPRLPNVDPGGDYVETTDGLTDCDGHGTLVAGIVAGQPGNDGFSGVAPAARLVSIRGSSAKFSPRTEGGDSAQAQASTEVAALAGAVVHAADLGARVINISEVTCLPADRGIDQSALGAALRYAAVNKDAVIVAAAGNTALTGSISDGSGCQSNPLTDMSHPEDSRNWAGVTSVSTPSWWQPYVLSVGSLTDQAEPSKFTMAGPWVGLAAPGENIVSVSNRDDGGLANGLPNQRQQQIALSGTSYSAAYVSGVAALVRSKYPSLPAAQVIQRITGTAHNGARAPSNLVGAGALDPVAALSWELPATSVGNAAPVKQIPAPPPPARKDPTPRIVAFAGTAALALGVLAAAIAARRRKELAK
jgi:membrane-anchored mycosin MYCP